MALCLKRLSVTTETVLNWGLLWFRTRDAGGLSHFCRSGLWCSLTPLKVVGYFLRMAILLLHWRWGGGSIILKKKQNGLRYDGAGASGVVCDEG